MGFSVHVHYDVIMHVHNKIKIKQGVALTGRNTTGPPLRAAPGELRCILECYRQRQTTDDDRRQSITSLHGSCTTCRRASNKRPQNKKPQEKNDIIDVAICSAVADRPRDAPSVMILSLIHI